MKVKICKSCGGENSPADIECIDCMGDISGIKPVEKIENVEKPEPGIADNSSATIREVKKTPVRDRLVLVSLSTERTGVILPADDGDVLGREHVGKDFFAAFEKVSRRHAKIVFCDGEWAVEDLDSMNGTYVNGSELNAGQKYTLKANDVVALSKSCEFLVEIGDMKR